jgi:small redox-active disulfide protein 2
LSGDAAQEERKTMIIQVLGPGCSRCKALFETVQKAVAEAKVDALVEKVDDMQKIMSYDILMTPGLVIDGQVKVAGRVPSLDEVRKLILAANPN